MREDAFTLMLVDPQLESLEALRFALKNHPIVVVVARDGCEALQIAEQHSPLVVLLECELPDMPGVDLAAALHDRSDAVFIFYSGLTQASYSFCTDKIRAAAFLCKSQPIETVVQTILLTARREQEKTKEVSSAMKQNDDMKRLIQTRAARESLLGAMSQAWQLDRDQTYTILVQFAQKKRIALDELWAMQNRFNRSLAELNKQFDAELQGITPEPLVQLQEFYLKQTGKHQLRPGLQALSSMQPDMFTHVSK